MSNQAARSLSAGAMALMLLCCLSWGFNQIAVKLVLHPLCVALLAGLWPALSGSPLPGPLLAAAILSCVVASSANAQTQQAPSPELQQLNAIVVSPAFRSYLDQAVVAVEQSADVGAVDLVPKLTLPMPVGVVVRLLPYESFKVIVAMALPPMATCDRFSERGDLVGEFVASHEAATV